MRKPLFRSHLASARARAAALCAAWASLAAPALAIGFDPVDGPPRTLVQSEDFEPPQPGEGLDWIRLKSGEWLKGDLERMRDESLEFDSDELDDLTFDWDDISALISERVQTLVLKDRRVFSGPLAMRGDAVRIRVGEEVHSFSRGDVFSLVAGAPSELNYWSGKVSAGITARSGNTDQTETTALLGVTREDAFTRSSLDYNGAVGELDGDKNVNNHRALAKFDWFVLPRFYVTPAQMEAYKDEFQNIDWRLTPASGIGYQLIDRPFLDVDTELAGGFQYTEFIEAPAGDDRYERQAAVIFSIDWESDLTEDIEWDGIYRVVLGVPDYKQTNHHFLTTLSFDLIWSLDFDVTFVWDRNETVRPDSDGDRPKRNDYRLTAGLGWDF